MLLLTKNQKREIAPEKQTDWIIDPFNLYYRYPLSDRLARVLKHTPLTPNQVTLLHTFIGLSAGYFVGLGTSESFLIAFWLYEVRMILDCLDGSLAREKKMYSEFGRQMDAIGDGLAYLGLLAGAGFAFLKTHSEFSPLQMSGLMLGTFQMLLLMAGAYDFYKRQYSSILKTGRDEPEDSYFRSQFRLKAGAGKGMDHITSFVDALQLMVLDSEMKKRVNLRVENLLRENPNLKELANDEKKLLEYSLSIPPSLRVNQVQAAAKNQTLEKRLRFLSFVSGDNHLMHIQFGLLSGNLWGFWWGSFVYMFVMFFGALFLHQGERKA